MSPSRKVLLFDLGGVLVHSDGLRQLRGRFPRLGDERAVLARWHRSQAVNQFERGLISPGAFATKFIEEWGVEIDESAFLAFFTSWVKGFFDGAIPLVRSLRAHYRVGCLSNTNVLHWVRLPEVPSLFHSSFASHLTGFMKPGRESFEHALGQLQVPADEVYYFDDIAQNVSAAREVGMKAFRANGLAELRSVLRTERLYLGE